MNRDGSSGQWTDDDSRSFIDHGSLFVPRREEQMDALVSLLPRDRSPLRVLELCCGEGLLARRILETVPGSRVEAIDGSSAMVIAARETNDAFGDRFGVEVADLIGFRPQGPLDAIVSSMAVHHLDHAGKRSLFEASHEVLAPGGALLFVDLVDPINERVRALSARAWDDAVAEAASRAGRDEALLEFRQGDWNHFALDEPDPIDRPAPLADQLDWLRAAGFAEADVFWLYAGHAVFGGFKR